MTDRTLPYNIEAVRADFPILQQEHHAGVPLIYLDNAASSQKPRQVIDAIDDYYRRYNANVHRGIHKLSEAATAAYEEARIKVKKFINAANKREVIYVRGTTEGINLVAQTWGRANLKSGDTVVLTQMEHHSNIVPWQMLAAEKGFTIRYVPVLPDGTLDMDVYDALLRDEPVKLVSVMYVSNVLGTVNPIAHMAKLAHDVGALMLVDGAQAVPHLPVDVQALDADFFTFSGHKMIGPTGSGILTLDGSTWNELPYKFEAGTPSIAEGIGLGAAVDYLTSIGMDKIRMHEEAITAYALDRLSEVPGLTLYGPDADQKGAVAAFSLKGIHAHDIAQLLDAEGIAVRAGHHCAMPLHDCLNIPATARASFYLYNTFAEVDALIDALYKAKKKFSV
ncbi:MAG: aminotransferase class V-fold PLP-dependent enzyme [Chloroflexi bacterium]|uniref:aminotransferase class V-fold PLP-dependent enzyme n=1 Tax=Candidatus Flexifilum breve TaxID=3140694 RepID=UPI0031375B53|nr:aminotransferase class V-fold PLP-dependent enzyme [Chloroflexota bacterium]